MDARLERGKLLSRDRRIKGSGRLWVVPSQTDSTQVYRVDLDARTCSCPDHETRAVKCKHMHAVEIVLKQTTVETVTNAAGEMSVRAETRETRLTYAQNWPAYNAAQTTEKDHVGRLLRALCDGIQAPTQTRGRPRLPLADVVHAAAMKTYVGMSGRRATTDVRECEAKGLIAHAPCYNAIFAYLERPEMTGLLRTLVEESAAPLKVVETNFAIDSTGFGTTTYRRWYDHKYGREMSEQRWIKAHAMVGVVTNVVSSVEVTDAFVHDSPLLPQLVNATAQRFTIAEISADKGYIANSNLEAIERIGAVPYIPFRSNAKGDGPEAWRRMYSVFTTERPRFLAHYHQRSNSETTFSAIKRMFGASVRAKLPTSQKNEVLLKCLAFNATCLVHAMHELGIKPTFPTVSAARLAS
jgi:transposase